MQHLEDDEQEKVVAYCKYHSILCFSIPNGTNLSGNIRRKTQQMMRLKKTGLLTGASDLVVMLDSKILFIEMKKCRSVKNNGEYRALSSDGISVSTDQLAFMDKVDKFSYADSTVAFGADEAISFINKHKEIK